MLSEPENLDKLFFEITDLLDAKAWVGEDLRITIRRNVQNAPGRAYYRMTDGANIVDNSASVDFNEKSRLTRMLIYWHKSVLGKKDDPAAFDRLDIAVDADAEASYGDVVEKKVFCRWIDPITNEEDSAETYVKNLGMRQVRRSRDAQPLIALSLSLRDLGDQDRGLCPAGYRRAGQVQRGPHHQRDLPGGEAGAAGRLQLEGLPPSGVDPAPGADRSEWIPELSGRHRRAEGVRIHHAGHGFDGKRGHRLLHLVR